MKELATRLSPARRKDKASDPLREARARAVERYFDRHGFVLDFQGYRDLRFYGLTRRQVDLALADLVAAGRIAIEPGPGVALRVRIVGGTA